MTYDEFLEEVEKRTELSDELEASTAVTATLNTLSERLNPDERENLAAQLPQGLKNLVTIKGEKQELSIDEFFDRVSQRMDTDRERAEEISDEIISVLTELITRGEVQDIKDHFPDTFRPLFETNSR